MERCCSLRLCSIGQCEDQMHNTTLGVQTGGVSRQDHLRATCLCGLTIFSPTCHVYVLQAVHATTEKLLRSENLKTTCLPNFVLPPPRGRSHANALKCKIESTSLIVYILHMLLMSTSFLLHCLAHLQTGLHKLQRG